MKQSHRIESSQFVVKTGKNGKPVIVDLHDKEQKIVCGFSRLDILPPHNKR